MNFNLQIEFLTRGILPLLWIYLVLCSSCFKISSGSWWLLSRSHMSSVSVDMQCKNIPGLEKKQRAICLQNPDIMPSICRGAKLGVVECQAQLKDRRWNCATVETGSNIFGKVTEKIGSREAAFVYAISSAGVAYSIAKSCASGELSGCGCDRIKQGQLNDTEGAYNWQGCGSFISYSTKFAKKFIDAREGAMTDSRALMNLHNNRAGRKAVIKFTEKLCKCHGISGTCSVRTCWKSLKSFNEIGRFLRKRYDGAVQVTLQQKGSIMTDNNFKPFTKFDLVYFEPSPDYCVEDKTIGTVGTAGRECSRRSRGPDSCNVLCCGMGYDTKRVTTISKCKCKFHYCCHVTCEECHETKDIHTCKSLNIRRSAENYFG